MKLFPGAQLLAAVLVVLCKLTPLSEGKGVISILIEINCFNKRKDS